MRKLIWEIVQLLAAKTFFWALAKRIRLGQVEMPDTPYQGMSQAYLIADHPRPDCVWQSYLMMVPLDRATGMGLAGIKEFTDMVSGRMN